ncbi:MAG: glutamate-5-semialdehyde dehydrogenase [Caldilineales bacterium]|nr:glutamate-5-semialdehyde dehydrogenase [Caldilineales bacterium]MDW8318532.1 glutamate-5-semialdehyde dehydrogenase [Anaerolineae bacterium]
MTESPLASLGRRAKAASRVLARASTAQKNAALYAIADGLARNQAQILAANAQDVADAQAAGLSPALVDRLLLNEKRLAGMAADTRAVAALPDPVGQEFDGRVLPNGLRVARRRTPLGVLGVIYEARPNVTVDVASLSLKTGNAAILRGGKETLRSNLALVDVIHAALEEAGLPADAVLYVDNPDRALVTELLRLDKYVDMIIPRGGNALHQLCREQATIPVMTGGIGICHLYVDATADQAKAVEIIHNAKTQRPTVCNALDTVLVHRDVAADFLPKMAARLAPDGVELRADPTAFLILERTLHASTDSSPFTVHGLRLTPAGPDDFDQEWLSLILGVKVVSGLDEAIEHIAQHSTGHSDGILTETYTHAQRFVNEVDSAVVYVNASTRFTDGGQLGLGAEVAVSTQKLHARGPMGLQELTTYKWVVLGDGHVRE